MRYLTENEEMARLDLTLLDHLYYDLRSIDKNQYNEKVKEIEKEYGVNFDDIPG